MTFGMLYWLMPRMFQAPLWSKKLANIHFWHATVGILLYIVPIYVAGLTQGLMWRAIDSSGNLAYADFVETVMALMPMYWLRVLGGTLYLAGGVMCGINCLKTMAARPAVYDEPVLEAPALSREYVDPPPPESRMHGRPWRTWRIGSTSGCRAGGTAAGNAARSALRSGWRSP